MRVRAVVVAVAALVAVLWPVARHPQVDSFPLSTYPMFTQVRPRVTALEVVVGVDGAGRDVPLDPGLVGGTIEVIQAAATVGASIRHGTATELCEEIAGRVAGGGRTEVVEVVVVTDRYDVVAALAKGAPPAQRTIHARCEVPW